MLILYLVRYNNFFVCFSNNGTPICLINDNLYEFQKINCSHSGNDWSNEYKVYYFRDYGLPGNLDAKLLVFWLFICECLRYTISIS